MDCLSFVGSIYVMLSKLENKFKNWGKKCPNFNNPH